MNKKGYNGVNCKCIFSGDLWDDRMACILVASQDSDMRLVVVKLPRTNASDKETVLFIIFELQHWPNTLLHIIILNTNINGQTVIITIFRTKTMSIN